MGSRSNLKSSAVFISSGLDSKQPGGGSGVNFYGENDAQHPQQQHPSSKQLGGGTSIQYHILDPSDSNSMNKSSIHKYQYPDEVRHYIDASLTTYISSKRNRKEYLI